MGMVISTNTQVIGAQKNLSQTSITESGSQTAFFSIDTAIITNLSEQRGNWGACRNRLECTVRNLATTRENLSASKSRIRDVDVASESTKMMKSRIFIQAGTLVLALANDLSDVTLGLIG